MEKKGEEVKIKGKLCPTPRTVANFLAGTDFVVKNVGKLRDHYRIGRKLGEGTDHH